MSKLIDIQTYRHFSAYRHSKFFASTKLITMQFWSYKVPDGLEKNKMSLYITSSSPPSEYNAYINQFVRDFTAFLRMRSEEMVSNGRMVLTLIGRKTLDDPRYRDCCHWLTLLSDSLCDLVYEVIKLLYFVDILIYMDG